MLNWLSTGKPDHPMANMKKARQMVAELLGHESFRVLDEAAGWLDSINGTEGFALDHRLELIDLLDRGGKYHTAKLAQEYLDAPRLQKAYEGRLWNTSFGYWKTLGAGYLHCIEQYQADAPGGKSVKKDLVLLSGRALRSLGMQLKWLLLRYGRVEDRIWRDLGRTYLFAEAHGLAAQRAAIYPGAHGDSSVREEFARALMLAMSAPDGLSPVAIHIAERVIAHFSTEFAVQTAPGAGCRFGFDLNMHRPPARTPSDARPGPMVRYFGPGTVVRSLRQLALDIEQKDGLPEALALDRKLDKTQVTPVLAHLEQYWADRPPARGAPRNELATRITVVPGFAAILRWVQVVMDTSSLEFSNPESAESWIVFNTSDGGYGAIVPAMRADWLAIGSLIGIRPETADSCCVGIVRRVTRDQYNQRRVGIQALGTIAVPVTLSAAASDGSAVAGAKGAPALLLSTKPDRNGEISVLLRAGAYGPDRSVHMPLQKTYLLAPVALKETGEDYDWAQFKVVKQM
ncbi:MAG: hypothetical protein ACT4P8_19410 [Betaproteobacteria bacterium]